MYLKFLFPKKFKYKSGNFMRYYVYTLFIFVKKKLIVNKLIL